MAATQGMINARADAIDNALGNLQTSVNALQTSLNNQMAATQGMINARADAIDGALGNLQTSVDALQTSLNTQIGETKALIKAETDAIDGALGSLQTSVNAIPAVQLQVVEVKDKERFLVSATDSGMPAQGAKFVSVLAISARDNNSADITNVTANTKVTEIAPGIFDVQIALPKGAKDVNIFLFNVSYKPSSNVTHSGSALFSHQDNRNLGS